VDVSGYALIIDSLKGILVTCLVDLLRIRYNHKETVLHKYEH